MVVPGAEMFEALCLSVGLAVVGRFPGVNPHVWKGFCGLGGDTSGQISVRTDCTATKYQLSIKTKPF